MHGLGNDFVVVDGVTQPIYESGEHNMDAATPRDNRGVRARDTAGRAASARDNRVAIGALTRAARAICDRRFGIGADGLILVLPSAVADFRMHYVNSDGSISAMCGNGIRCVGKFVYESGLATRDELAIETGSGIVNLELSVIDGSVAGVTVDMGAPDFDVMAIPAQHPDDRMVEAKLKLDGETLVVTCLSMGNPHCVHFIEERISVEDYPVERIGRKVENLTSVFPERTNAEFAKVTAPDRVDLRVWERGCGETLACGSGACAAVAAGIVTGRLANDKPVAVRLPGGVLEISWSGKPGEGVRMFGPAEAVFAGEFDLDKFAAD